MLYKSVHFKLVLVFVIFIILIIVIVGTIMLIGVFQFYTDDFNNTMSQTLNDDILKELSGSMGDRGTAGGNFYDSLRDRLKAEYGNLGINSYRNAYILDMDGNYLAGSNDMLGANLIKTPNMLEAMNKKTGNKQSFGADYMDYAVYLKYSDTGGNTQFECIIYIKDTQEQLRNFSWMIFGIIIQALLIGLIIAVLLSFVLANAITSPIQSITKSASKLAEGDFKEKIEIESNDEIGTLAETYNYMAEKLKSTLDEVSSEREKLRFYILYLKEGVLIFSDEKENENDKTNSINSDNAEKLILINPQGEEIFGNDCGYNNNFDDFLNLLKLKQEYEKYKNTEDADKHIFRDVTYKDNVFDINIGKYKYPQEEGTIVVMHDITQRYALEKSRREFIANVSHELKTPLSTIMIGTETILDERIPGDVKTNALNMILREIDRMNRIVGDLLLVSRIDTKKMMWQFSRVSLEELAKNIQESMQGEAKKNSQRFIVKIGLDIPVIYADKGRIEQVLINIISNAMRYTPKDGNGRIEFAVSSYKFKDGKNNNPELSGVKITVKDNGIGIPKEDLPHIFERFYRVEKARSAESGGTGLGLSIAKEIANAHNGEIMIDSVLGAGTTVTVILPQNVNLQEQESL
ncbi:MAG: cell wall metabolism sensor histidine kinase WalK [Oscillospiraceae bacterium]|nr:cell wall metabolism sensor histidine kinase WalK [Oscillospiraceae bacterium]